MIELQSFVQSVSRCACPFSGPELPYLFARFNRTAAACRPELFTRRSRCPPGFLHRITCYALNLIDRGAQLLKDYCQALKGLVIGGTDDFSHCTLHQ